VERSEVMRERRERGGAAKGRLHLMGLVSDGGVHSHLEHLKALVRLARRRDVGEIFIHAFTDGRDTPPRSGRGYLKSLQEYLDLEGAGAVASVVGRYFAMDRDNRWERTEKAYRCLLFREGDVFDSARSEEHTSELQ